MNPGITIDGNTLLVVPPTYPSTEVKEVLGGRWDKEQKGWKVQPTSLNVLVLQEWYGDAFIRTAPKSVQDLADLPWGFEGFSEENLREAEEHPKWETLYPFQKEAVEYLMCNPHRGSLLGLSPGLGKTPTATIAADLLGLQKILIVAPLTLTKNWIREIEAWSDTERDVTYARASDKRVGDEVTVTNFETLFYTILRDEDGNTFNEDDDEWVRNARTVKAWIDSGPRKRAENNKMVPVRERIVQARPQYSEIDWDLIISDESILLKNRKAVKVDVLRQLAKYAHYVWLLSGSPTAKFKDDLYPQLSIIFPRGFTSYWRFAEFFCVVDKGQWGWSIEGDVPGREVSHYLRDFCFIRNQKDVLPDLPDYIYDPIEIDLNQDQAKAFDQMLNEWVLELEDEEETGEVHADNRLAQSVRLQQVTSNMCNLEKAVGRPVKSSSAKEDLLFDLIKQGDIEFPLLVWCWWVPTAEHIAERFAKEQKDLSVALVHGSIKEDKQDVIQAYKDGEHDVLILQMGVGKFGHTLTDTRTVYYHDRSFDSDAYLQSLRRVKRIGLTHRPRLVVPRAPLSADPLVELNLAGKMQSVARVAAHDLIELLKSLGGTEVPWAMDTPGDV